ncbi:MAG: hypothetical protein FWC16_00800 [Defluviitaleaceae bacterium]|nr:hypothetical protein [Defluviitaleaceae bacterium]MCL2273443.1 hypothetical protein [Defluviitaleaceae bacterium]
MAIRPVAVLGGVLLDAVEADKPTHQFDVTDKAVESGASIADHMQARPAELSISGVVVGGDASSRLSRIRQMQRNRQLVPYVNRVIFTQMAIVNISTEHDATVGNGFKFNIQLRQVRTATAGTVSVAAPAPVASKAAPPQNAGTQQVRQTNKQANNKEADRRIASAVSSGGGGGLAGGEMAMLMAM